MAISPSVAIEQKLDRKVQNLLRQPAPNMFSVPDTPNDRFAAKLGKQVTYAEVLSNKMLAVQLIRGGLPYSFFELVRDYAPLTETDWTDILDLSTKTLSRYKQEDKTFKPIHSEKILEMAEVTTIGLQVFGDMEKLKSWLDTPSFALGNLKPVELLRDSYGKDLVLAELGRINHGILS